MALLSDRVKLTGRYIQNICSAARDNENVEKSYCVLILGLLVNVLVDISTIISVRTIDSAVEGWVCGGAIVPHGVLVMNQYPSNVTVFGHKSLRDSLTLVTMNFLPGISPVTQGKDSTVSFVSHCRADVNTGLWI